jgi:hypothetical protein
VNEWSVIVYYTDAQADHWIFQEAEAPTVVDCLKLVETEAKDKTVAKVIVSHSKRKVNL